MRTICWVLALSGFLHSAATGRADDDHPDTRPAVADAAQQQMASEVSKLIRAGANINAAQADGMTALHWAVYHEDTELTAELLVAGANVAATNRYGVRPLSIACLNGNAPTVDLLLKSGADPQTELPGGETVLMTAARTGRLAVVQALLTRGADVNAREHRKQTALMWAAAAGHVDVVDALLQAKADFETPLNSGFTPLFFAVREGRTDVALRLLEAGLDVNAAMRDRNRKPGPNPLLLAVENAHFETAVALLRAGADPDAQPQGHGALHAIAGVRKPIRGDGNPPPVGSGNIGALECVRQIVAAGGDVNLQLARGKSGRADFTTTGCSPLIFAARTGDLPLLKVLLELGADSTLTNKDNSTALLAAAGIGDLGSGQETAGSEAEAIATVRLLLSLGADINAADKNGETAMHGAAYQNWPRMIAFLTENGADPSSWHRTNRWGWTPLTIARGYRKGNFRPDPDTIDAVTTALQTAGLPVPAPPGPGFKANSQSWDKKPPKKPAPRGPSPPGRRQSSI